MDFVGFFGGYFVRFNDRVRFFRFRGKLDDPDSQAEYLLGRFVQAVRGGNLAGSLFGLGSSYAR